MMEKAAPWSGTDHHTDAVTSPDLTSTVRDEFSDWLDAIFQPQRCGIDTIARSTWYDREGQRDISASSLPYGSLNQLTGAGWDFGGCSEEA